ncbi:MAG: phage protein GemA/Gp16 family protein [Stenotrophomonas sp.]|uniref:phage protein GemA/Gp16 family protein n=1 Tax=Stenotrophomonas sp. TaxID=69392 RepID=UPI003D6D97DE
MTPTRKAGDARNRVLAAIHAGAKKLGLPEDVYRDLVERVSKEHGQAQRSAGKCDRRQLDAIANELRRLGGIPAKAAQAAQQWAGRPKGELPPQLAKIEALLADAGREWEYAHAVARRICRVARLEWCSPAQLSKVIAALQIDADRRAQRESTPR